MSPAANPIQTLRACVLRPRQIILRPCNAVIGVKRPAYRAYSDGGNRELPKAQAGDVGPNMKQQEHVSEEAAKIAKAQGREGPDIEAGTPVQEVSNLG